MNYIQILKKGENFLKKSKIKNPYLDTELILSKVVNRKREEILLNTNNELKNAEIIKFKQLNIDLNNLSTTTIKKPKIQETGTIKMLNCFVFNKFDKFCNESAKKEMTSALNRRIVLPFYIPVISLIISLILFNSKNKFLNKTSIFIYSFFLLVIIEMSVRYTGFNSSIRKLFFATPFMLIFLIYSSLIFKFKHFSIKNE